LIQLLSRILVFNNMKLKISVVISLFIFWSLFTAIVVAGLLSNDSKQLTNNNSLTTVSSGQSQITLSAAEVAKHSTTSDCWLIISNKVYDVTNYFRLHPGGASTITPYCGKDGTKAFETKDLGSARDHSSSAYALLQDYYLGDLNQTLNNSVSGITPSPTTKILPTPTIAIPVAKTNVVLTLAEVAKHNTSSDCWMVISGNVYNFTNYLRAHPGGVSTMTPYCGKDGTAAFVSRGGTGSHSSFASSLLASYFVGTLNQSVGTTTIQNTQSITPSVSQRRGDDD
jgi:cytochrome b involved in lipid metabolism